MSSTAGSWTDNMRCPHDGDVIIGTTTVADPANFKVFCPKWCFDKGMEVDNDIYFGQEYCCEFITASNECRVIKAPYGYAEAGYTAFYYGRDSNYPAEADPPIFLPEIPFDIWLESWTRNFKTFGMFILSNLLYIVTMGFLNIPY